jgi:polyhydroxyalkanoate synthase
VAGVINPASKNRRHYWIGGEQGKSADHWFDTSTQQEGSWWTHWGEWLKRRAGKKQDAPTEFGNATFKVIEPAPGRYVSARID